MDLLEIKDFEIYEELMGAAVCNLNDDKILVIKEIAVLEQAEEITFLLPSVRTKIQEKIINERNKDDVGENFPLSKFLWDIYVIGLHDLSSGEERFEQIEVAKIQHNRFAARKIIIEFENYSELVSSFNQLVVPEKTLDQLLRGYNNTKAKVDYTEIEELLNLIDDLITNELEEQ